MSIWEYGKAKSNKKNEYFFEVSSAKINLFICFWTINWFPASHFNNKILKGGGSRKTKTKRLQKICHEEFKFPFNYLFTIQKTLRCLTHSKIRFSISMFYWNKLFFFSEQKYFINRLKKSFCWYRCDKSKLIIKFRNRSNISDLNEAF